MKAVNVQKPSAGKPSKTSTSTLGGNLLRLFGLMVFDAFSLFFIYLLLSDGYWQLAAVLGVVVLMVNYVFLREDAYPLRWMSPGLAFMILISAYPIIFTIYIAFTNYGTGNLLPKTQAVEVLEQRQFLPEEGITYDFLL
ncbi:MAG: hypothetical protein GY943_17710, partial [Chloroflexi bacterium]|nr:hypothetical protein [Chloroflexota bacterium]